MVRPCLLLALVLVATSLIAADAVVDDTTGLNHGIKCHVYAKEDATGGTPPPTVPCFDDRYPLSDAYAAAVAAGSSPTTDCIKDCKHSTTKCYRMSAMTTASGQKSAGGCAPAFEINTYCDQLNLATDHDGFQCAECTTDLCNSTAGLSVGGLSMAILGTVMQLLV